LGSLRDRTSVLAFLNVQREAEVATHDEVMISSSRPANFTVDPRQALKGYG
jgi:hypothetical protein